MKALWHSGIPTDLVLTGLHSLRSHKIDGYFNKIYNNVIIISKVSIGTRLSASDLEVYLEIGFASIKVNIEDTRWGAGAIPRR